MVAINFDDVNDLIYSSKDGEIYQKQLIDGQEKWVEYTNSLFKGKEFPEKSNNGDIFYNKETFEIFERKNNSWVKNPNIDIYYTDTKLSSSNGEIGSLNCIKAIIELAPVVLIGNGKNIPKHINEEGVLYINDKDKRLYIKTNFGDYRINYQYEKPTQAHSITNALLFNTDMYDDIVYRKTLYG